MVYGAISIDDEQYYTYLKKVFEAIDNKQLEYNWLITDCVCYLYDKEIEDTLRQEYCWISGEELTKIVTQDDFQWIWAVLSAFDKSVTLDEVLKYDLPYADGYAGFWKNPLSLQTPLTQIEIVPFDSSYMLILSKDKNVIDSFKNHYPKSQDLEEFNDGFSSSL